MRPGLAAGAAATARAHLPQTPGTIPDAPGSGRSRRAAGDDFHQGAAQARLAPLRALGAA
jgi:hypothetical protein